MEFRNAEENEFDGVGNLVIWLLKASGNFFKGAFTNPDNIEPAL